MNYYFEPINLKQWNLFDKVKHIGHIEPFLATKKMEVGDIVLLHVGSQDRSKESGIYAYGTIVKGPYVLRDSPQDYCNNKNTVDIRIDRLDTLPIFTHEECKGFIKQFRTVHQIKPEYYNFIKNRI